MNIRKLVKEINRCPKWRAHRLKNGSLQIKGDSVTLRATMSYGINGVSMYPAKLIVYYDPDPSVPWERNYAWGSGWLSCGEDFGISHLKDCVPFADEPLIGD